MYRVLITGATGFLGRNLHEALRERDDIECVVGASKNQSAYRGPSDYILQGDLTSYNDARHIFDKSRPNLIYHLAADASVANSSMDMIRTNMKIMENMLECCTNNPRFIFASSTTVYGPHPGGSASRHQEHHVRRPNSLYGVSKVLCEEILNQYTRDGVVSGLSLRFCAMVGRHMINHGLLRDVILKLGGPDDTLKLLGEEPGSHKPYLNIEDAVKAMLLFSIRNNHTGAINVVNDDYLSVKEVAEVAMKEMGVFKDIEWQGKKSLWKGDDQRVWVSNYFAKQNGWQPTYSSSREAIQHAMRKMRQCTKS